MDIIYKESTDIDFEELKKLFASVGWLNGEHPEELKTAIDNSATVFTAWHGSNLIGLVNAIDDRSLAVYVNYVLVSPEYQGKRIGQTLIEHIKQKYADYLYILLLTEEKSGQKFYEKCGFYKSELIPMIYDCKTYKMGK